MGVYVFQSLAEDWVKVGHHRVTPRRPNVWYRVARRGFGSCKGPACLEGKTTVDRLNLLAFYPNLTTKEEKRLHREHRSQRVGEWYPASMLPGLIQWLEGAGGVPEEVPEEARAQALAWAKKG